ncbi:MAG: PQQ-dependent sugar dehydrogenase [Gemmatimonadetes bacterium]|nr:PQQ-dependent sugar dehydrogenase [Gemmatimonadota bacterium]
MGLNTLPLETGQKRQRIASRRHAGLSIIVATACAVVSACDPADVLTPDDGRNAPGVIAYGFTIPDALTVIGDEEFLFLERGGTVYRYDSGEVTVVSGIPSSRMSDVYGGLLDLSLHPDFPSNSLVYLAYNDASHDLAVARFELRGDRAENLEVIFESDDFSIGSRIVWEDADHFFLSAGIGGDPYPDPGPQDLDSDVGKIHRLLADGRIPPDNPVLPGRTEPSSIWSFGHRNPQGLHFDDDQGILYAVEHGPLGGDELNVVEAGGNYGWPDFSYGLNYDRTPVSNMTEEQAEATSILPLAHWTPAFRVAPSGLHRVEGGADPSWQGSFLIGALYRQDLLRYDPVTEQTDVVRSRVGRVRDIAQFPGGDYLIAVDAGSPAASLTGRIIRFGPNGAPP